MFGKHALLPLLAFTCSLTVALCGCQTSPPPPQRTYQVGDRVMVIKAAKLAGEEPDQEDVFIGLVLTVRDVQGNQLQVGQIKPGWLDASHVMPVADAPQFLNEALVQEPDNAQLKMARAMLSCERKEWDLAIADYDELIRQFPSQAALRNGRGVAWEGKENFDKAISDYTMAIIQEPKIAGAYSNRSHAWILKGDFDQAIIDCDQAIRLDPVFAYAYYCRGIAWHGKEDYKNAKKDFSFAIQLSPKNAFAYSSRAVTELDLGRDQEALHDAEAGYKLDPQGVWPMAALAWVLATAQDEKFRDGQRALQLAKQAFERDKTSADCLRSLAAAHAELGEFEEAVQYQKVAVSRATNKSKRNESQQILEVYQQGKPYRVPPAPQ